MEGKTYVDPSIAGELLNGVSSSKKKPATLITSKLTEYDVEILSLLARGLSNEDIALAVDALQVGLDSKIDIAILVTGDGDLVPLVRALNKQGIRVLVAYFDFIDGQGKKSFINQRLLKCCNYAVDIARLEEDKDFKSSFNSLFQKQIGYEERMELKNSDLGRELVLRHYQEK